MRGLQYGLSGNPVPQAATLRVMLLWETADLATDQQHHRKPNRTYAVKFTRILSTFFVCKKNGM